MIGELCDAFVCGLENKCCWTYFVLQNVSPAHAPDVVIFVDAIAVVFEEALQGGPPLSLPVACIDAGNDHSLPNLPLRYLSPQNILIWSLSSANVMELPWLICEWHVVMLVSFMGGNILPLFW